MKMLKQAWLYFGNSLSPIYSQRESSALILTMLSLKQPLSSSAYTVYSVKLAHQFTDSLRLPLLCVINLKHLYLKIIYGNPWSLKMKKTHHIVFRFHHPIFHFLINIQMTRQATREWSLQPPLILFTQDVPSLSFSLLFWHKWKALYLNI